MPTNPTNGIAREAWRAAVTAAAEKARVKFPALVDAIDLAEQLVLAGEVELHPDGSATIASQRDAGTTYTVQGQRCSCPKGQYAKKDEFCKHTFAVLLYRRALDDTKATIEATVSAEETHSPIPPQWVVEIQGTHFILYRGLLAMAHERGLVRLEATFVSVTPDLALATATATFADGRTFTEAADATPANVGSRIKIHFPRLALTRAKARCLRDALNIDLTALEELEG